MSDQHIPSKDEVQSYVCIRVLVNGEREQAVHVTSVPLCEYEALAEENAKLKGMLLDAGIQLTENARLLLKHAKHSETPEAHEWIAVEDRMPPPHTHVWCLNRDGRQFEGAPCYGMHAPFFTVPHGDGSPSNTAPAWIDVTHWRPLPAVPAPKTPAEQS